MSAPKGLIIDPQVLSRVYRKGLTSPERWDYLNVEAGRIGVPYQVASVFDRHVGHRTPTVVSGSGRAVGARRHRVDSGSETEFRAGVLEAAARLLREDVADRTIRESGVAITQLNTESFRLRDHQSNSGPTPAAVSPTVDVDSLSREKDEILAATPNGDFWVITADEVREEIARSLGFEARLVGRDHEHLRDVWKEIESHLGQHERGQWRGRGFSLPETLDADGAGGSFVTKSLARSGLIL